MEERGEFDRARATTVSQRQRILDIALSLMSQHGVDGTSMRDLAGAAGLNVATIYHYFPSKRDLLVAVLQQRGIVPESGDGIADLGEGGLAELLSGMVDSMLESEDFVRLMLGEVMRGQETALAIGTELITDTRESLEKWLAVNAPELCETIGPASMAQMLVSALVGLFFEHVSGVLDEGDDPAGALRLRAMELARALEPRG